MSLERDDTLLVKFTVEVGIAEGRELQLGEHATREAIEDLHIDAAIRNKVNVMLDSRIGLSYDDGVYTSVEQEVSVGIGVGHAQECPCPTCRPRSKQDDSLAAMAQDHEDERAQAAADKVVSLERAKDRLSDNERERLYEDEAEAAMNREEAFAALLFDSEHWDEDSPRPTEETAHRLAKEVINFIG